MSARRRPNISPKQGDGVARAPRRALEGPGTGQDRHRGDDRETVMPEPPSCRPMPCRPGLLEILGMRSGLVQESHVTIPSWSHTALLNPPPELWPQPCPVVVGPDRGETPPRPHGGDGVCGVRHSRTPRPPCDSPKSPRLNPGSLTFCMPPAPNAGHGGACARPCGGRYYFHHDGAPHLRS